MPLPQDHYRTLDVEPKASAREIKRAYLKLARREHPDVNPGDREAPARWARIQEAWRVLSSRSLRAEYDRLGRQPPPPAAPAADAARGGRGEPRRWEQMLGDLFPESDAPPEPVVAPSRGEDVHQVVEVSFEEAMRGARRECLYQRQAPCPDCHGRRWAPGAVVRPCEACAGHGVVEVPHGPWTVRRICPGCSGEGESGEPACATCRGRGRMPSHERRGIRIPAGSATGSRVVVAGAGQPGRRGGGPGDLVVTVRVQHHPTLERRGQNLYTKVQAPLPLAVLGGPLRVPTIEGSSTMRLPPGTQGGQQFTLRGKGVPPSGEGKRGDLYVTVVVQIPSGEDPGVRRAMQELEKALAAQGRADA